MTANSVEVGSVYGRLTVMTCEGRNKYSTLCWLCKCECGNETIVSGQSLKRGTTKSCGCLRKEYVAARVRKPKGVAAFNKVYRSYFRHATQRDLEFSLTKDQFKEMTKQNCYYCGVEPQAVATQKGCNGNYTYNGVDRIDNTVGYAVENCVPCCATCNRAKLAMTKDGFLKWVDRVYEYQHRH